MIDMNKKYRTRDGREVRIYATDGAEDYPVHGAIKQIHGWDDACWTAGGLHNILDESPYDLTEVKGKITLTGFMNIYRDKAASVHYNKATADFHVQEGRIACIDVSKYRIEFEEGEGL